MVQVKYSEENFHPLDLCSMVSASLTETIKKSCAESHAVVVQASIYDIEFSSPWGETQFPACLHTLCVCCSTLLRATSSKGSIDLLMRTSELYPIHTIPGISEPDSRYFEWLIV